MRWSLSNRTQSDTSMTTEGSPPTPLCSCRCGQQRRVTLRWLMHLHLRHLFFLSSSLTPSAPLLPCLLRFILSCMDIPQCQPQSSALWRVPRQDPVTPSMTSWFSLRSVSWKPMESKSPLFISFYPLLQQIGDLFPLNIGALAFIAPILFPFPATSLLWWTTEAGCPATARSSYIRSEHRLSDFLDLMSRKFVFVPSYEVKSSKKAQIKVWALNRFSSHLCCTGHPEENHRHNRSWRRKWFWVEGGEGACYRWALKSSFQEQGLFHWLLMWICLLKEYFSFVLVMFQAVSETDQRLMRPS